MKISQNRVRFNYLGMIKLLESIRIMNGRICQLGYHEERCNQTRIKLFSTNQKLRLREKIIIPELYQKGLVKCRLIYSTDIEDISFQQYEIRIIDKIKIVNSDSISYPFKFEERKELDVLFANRMDCDEIMIIKNGLVTDAYYYNYVFQKGKEYFTPKIPLLEGVMRSSLILSKRIVKKDIFASDLHQFDAIHLINAMTPLGKIIIYPNQITP